MAKKKENNWLSKYDVLEAENGIEGTMGGLTDQGFNYNGAWGGTMQMGGSLPGAVGFSYARTQSPAPNNGKYAKKTKASAQNGEEMKYYQEGLDWKPKSISRDGSSLPEAQGGFTVPNWASDLSTRLSNAVSTFGGSAIGDAVKGVSPQAAEYLNEYSAGFIPYTTDEQLMATRAGNPDRGMNTATQASDAVFNFVLGKAIGPLAGKANTAIKKGTSKVSKAAGTFAKDFMQGYKPNPETPLGFQNRVFNSNIQLGNYEGVGHLSEPGYNYRVLSPKEIVAIKESKGVFPRTGKQKGGSTNTKYWTKGNKKNWYGDADNLETIRVNENNFNPSKVVDSKHVQVYDKKTGKFKSLKQGGVIEDDRGQWEHPGEITKINSNQITMQGVDYPVLGISDSGDTQMMQPGQDYTYEGKSVTEYPMLQDGGLMSYREPIINAKEKFMHNQLKTHGDIKFVNKALDKADKLGYGFGESSQGPLDAVRHAAMSASVAKKLKTPEVIQKYTPALDDAIRMGVANLMGLGYEAANFNPDGFWMDLKNNYIGSNVGVMKDLSEEEKINKLSEMLTSGKLSIDNPKKSKKENGGWLNKYN